MAVLSIVVPSATFRTVAYLSVIVTLVPAAVIGARRNRASRAVWMFAAAMAVCFLITEIAASFRSPDRAMIGAGLFEDLARTMGELLYVGVLVAIVRVRRGRNVSTMVADATIVACGAWIVCYVTLIDPTLARSTQPALNTYIQGLYQPIGVAVVFMLAVVVFAETFRPISMWFLSTAILGALLGDLGYALEAAGHIDADWLIVADSGYIMAYVSAGAMFLHPSVRSLTEAIPVGHLRPQTNRMLLTTASLMLPVAVLAVTDATSDLDRVVRLVSALALCLAVTLRVANAISANERAQRALLLTAQHDSLTGLPNRALLGEQITEALHDAWREDIRPTVLFIDVDRFKNINDSLGHAVGDQVLRMLGRRLRAALPPHVRIGRISGDEFMALDATVRTMGEALAFADRVLSVFHEPIHVGAGDMYITASIGVAVAKANGAVSAEELHRNADTAMYRAKDAGRNCVALFDDSMHERVTQRLQTESALHRALDRRELALYYQPIVDLMTGEVTGFEALMRWHMADGRVVSPAEFIPIAEETGLIVPIGAWALLEALMQLQTWIEDGVCRPDSSMSVNLSPRQLRDPNLLSAVSEALLRSTIPASQLWLEVTEGVMISEPEQALTTMRRIRALGARLAIDDFGTGYSSLSMMRRFPLQRIKIDRAFVSGVADDDSARSLVHTIVAMADALGLDVVAEGVESMAQLRVLTSLGCRQAQGFLMSPPVPAASMRATIHQIERTTSWSGGMQLSWPES
ncbi:MAG: putative bifunctional diguanylate cyclase/phosphodiesterase [Acidimicrobiia bacterium]